MKLCLTILMLLVSGTLAQNKGMKHIVVTNAQFIPAFKLIKINEGGYVNDPDDPGLKTMVGISYKYNPKWRGWKYLFKDSLLTSFYVTDYYLDIWHKEDFDEIKDQYVANYLFDWRNSGTISIVINKKVLNSFGFGFKLDSSVTPEYIRAINSVEPKLLIRKVRIKRISYYKSVAYKTKHKYLKGWINRANK